MDGFFASLRMTAHRFIVILSEVKDLYEMNTSHDTFRRSVGICFPTREIITAVC